MLRDDRVYLLHMRDAGILFQTYISQTDFATFQLTRLLQDGVIRQLEIIGEAAKNVSTSTKRRAMHIPWRSMAGMRDKLIHQYFGVDLQQVWLTATEDIPLLVEEITVLLLQLEQGNSRL